MMQTERIRLQTLLSGEGAGETLAALAARIRAGAVFVYPTETIYGIGGIVTAAVKSRILAIKQRPPENPMILIGGRPAVFDRLLPTWSFTAEKLIAKFWPGNLTLVIPVDGYEEPTVGIRVSAHPFLQALYQQLDVPIYSTSANRSSEAYKNDPDVIFDTFNGAVDFMIDAGVLPQSRPSTVVTVSGDGEISILREGVISTADIMTTLR
jgi:L-threonylcarbamoyladenylate synthase